jgi:hypothetical protein
MTIEHFLTFYSDTYMRAYSDLVAYLADKPAQIVIEMENIAVHIARAVDPRCTERQREDNLDKAYNHLVRATIDCLKILWTEMAKDISAMRSKNSVMKGLSVDADTFMCMYLRFKELARQARDLEMSHVGTDPTRCIDAYAEVVSLAWDIVRLPDEEKIRQVICDLFPDDQIPPPA